MQDFEFLLNRRIAHGGRLQAVTQSFIGEKNRTGQPQRLRVEAVPVVDEFRDVHNSVFSSQLSLTEQALKNSGSIVEWEGHEFHSCRKAQNQSRLLAAGAMPWSETDFFGNLPLRFFLFLRHNRQSEDRELPHPADVNAARVFRVRQVKRLTEFAAIDFGV